MALFKDRADAARRLAQALAHFAGQNPLVLAVPRGGVALGRAVADALDAELDVVLVRKLGAPASAEYAVGAVHESGWTFISPHARAVGASDDYIRRERATQLDLLQTRRDLYTPHRTPISPTGRIAIVVDDGLATGATMSAALQAVRAQAPALLVCAVPVAAADSLELVKHSADEVVCVWASAEFLSVGHCYRSYPQIADDKVIDLLNAPAHAIA